MFIPYTKRILLIAFFLSCSHAVFAFSNKTDSIVASKADSLTITLKEQKSARHTTIDSLKHELNAIVDDSLKAPLYTRIASEYLKYDTIKSKKQRRACQNEAINNTMSAIHYYSKYNDTTGLRISFDALAKVYHAQHKYPQAKWFILQSNTLSRIKNDNVNIISSLIELSSIKTDIRDYTLAMRDLNEALMISSKNHMPQQQSQVQLHFALLYNVMKNYTKASIAMKRHNAIDDSIKRDEEARMMAKLNTKDSLQQVKKKSDTLNSKKKSTKKIALL